MDTYGQGDEKYPKRGDGIFIRVEVNGHFEDRNGDYERVVGNMILGR